MSKEVFICGCVSRNIMEAEKVARMAALLKQEGYAVNLVPDLCSWAEDEDAALESLEGKTVVGCHERAVSSLLSWRGVKVAAVHNLRTHTLAETAKCLGISSDCADEETIEEFRKRLAEFPTNQGKDAWYPIIDRNRCADCGKCHDFCLFGVYTLDEDGRVQVTSPQNCKNNCPACARTCPQEAVIFPKHDFEPINGGEAKNGPALKIDTKQLYNEALRERLAARRAGVSLLKKNFNK